MKYKYSFHPPKYALGEIESFYTNMAAKGFHLKKRGLWLSKFAIGNSTAMKYRVEVVSPRAFDGFTMPEEQLAVYEDCGWEYVDFDSYVHIFRAPADSDTQEFYLDPAQQARTLKGLRKDLLFSALNIPLTIAVIWLLGMMFGENNLATLYLAWLAETSGVLGLVSLFVFFMADGIAGTFHLQRLYSKMKRGIPLDHSPKIQGKGLSAIKLALLIFGVAAIAHTYTNKPYPMPLTTNDPYITFAELGYEGERTKSFSGRESEYTLSLSPFASYWDCFENISYGDGTGWMYQEVFLLKDSSQAEKVAFAFMENATFASEAKVFQPIEIEGLDKAWFTGGLECIAVKDNKVAIITKIFHNSLEAENLLNSLAEKWNSLPVEY